MDTYSNQSWFSRIKSALVGVIIGLLLFVFSFPVLISNEGRSIHTYQALTLGQGQTHAASIGSIDPNNQGKPIYLTGMAKTTSNLQDDLFSISVPALQLRRHVEMYQWQEKKSSEQKKNLGGSTTTKTSHTYIKTWSSSLIDSQSFQQTQGHQNPTSMPFSSKTFTATSASLGVFSLPPSLINKLSDRQTLPLSNVDFDKEELAGLPTHKLGDSFFLGNNPEQAQIGDITVSYKIIPLSNISVIAAQQNSSLSPYQVTEDNSIYLIQPGTVSIPGMYAIAQKNNQILTWLLRAGGLLMMFIGIMLILRPLSVLGDVVPFVGSLLSFGSSLIAIILTLTLGGLTIAISWFAYRPTLSIVIIVCACLLAFLIIKWRQSKKKQTTKLT